MSLHQILVTHHVELVLPAAYYLVRMLEGRIDTQGTVKELRALGVLDEIADDPSTEVEAKKGTESPQSLEQESDSGTIVVDASKQPRKLVQDEHRETGRVKWNIYRTYLKASWVAFIVFRISVLIYSSC
jgi:energy-coupling factor transporter ATP-binding protein EcfA2